MDDYKQLALNPDWGSGQYLIPIILYAVTIEGKPDKLIKDVADS
jgi:hypothetical protein